jgi:hypothetical protein
MKKCTYCGKEYPDETKVCAIDSQPLELIKPLPTNASVSKLDSQSEPGCTPVAAAVTSTSKPPMLVAAVVLVVAIFTVLWNSPRGHEVMARMAPASRGPERGPEADAQLMAEARKFIAEGLDQVVLWDRGEDIAFDFNCLPKVLEKWEQAATVLRPLRPAKVSTFDIHDNLDRVIATARACQGVSGTAGRDNIQLYQLIGEIGLLARLHRFPDPFLEKTGQHPSPKKSSLTRDGGAASTRSEITGLFGLRLGDELPTRLVRKIDGWREWAEAGVYSVTPPQPPEVFDSYTVELLGGPICGIKASRNGRGQALVHIYDDAKKELILQFGPPTSTDAVDDRGDSGIAWDQNLRYCGRVRMTLAMRKDSTFASGAVIPGMVMLDLQKIR